MAEAPAAARARAAAAELLALLDGRQVGERTMPTVPAERLDEICRALFVAAGTPPAEAETVVRHCIAANLAGHDSHGVIQVPTYIERIKVGHIVPGAPWKIVQETATTTVVDG